MERRAELARITHWRGNLWTINYKLWAACGCYYNRYVIEYRGKEPTIKQAEKLINEDKIKR